MRISAVIGVVLAALALTAPASAGVTFGTSDDAGKYANDRGRQFLSLISGVGFTENRVTVRWDAARPTTIVDKPFLDRYIPVAQRRGIKVVLAVYPDTATGVTATADGQNKFVDFLVRVARTYPQVTKIIVGNEPNQPRFWQPQFNADGSAAAGPAYEALLAQAYDALKRTNPAITVVGLALNSHGNDDATATSNVSTSPVKFIRDVGAAYRTSARNVPIMDELSFHPYPAKSTDTIAKGYQWPNAGFANLDRIKQAVWDAFNGTGQPVVSDGAGDAGLKIRIDEIAWQTAIPGSSAGVYTGAENVPVTDDTTQAGIYADLVKQAECDSSIEGFAWFGFIDERNLDAFQGGFIRADGTLRPAYDAVRAAISAGGGACAASPVNWLHTTKVVDAEMDFGKLKPKPAFASSWAFTATAGEDAAYKAGIVKVKGPSSGKTDTVQRALASVKAPSIALSTQGNVKAYWSPRVQFPQQKLKAGWYVYAIRLNAVVNPARTSFFMSKPFRVGPKKSA